MMQRAGGGLRGLSGPVAPQALISVCHSIVSCAGEMPLVDMSPSVWISAYMGSR